MSKNYFYPIRDANDPSHVEKGLFLKKCTRLSIPISGKRSKGCSGQANVPARSHSSGNVMQIAPSANLKRGVGLSASPPLLMMPRG